MRAGRDPGSPAVPEASTSGYELVEHTADVGLRAWGATLEHCFEQATWALAAIIGIDRPGAGELVALEVEAADLGGLLVDWLSEVLYLHDTRDMTLAGVEIESVGAGRARGTITLSPRQTDADGTQVKAVTYHRLSVARVDGRFVAQVYVDV